MENEVNQPASGPSPWCSIWNEPRATIERIIRSNPNKDLWLLASVHGFSSLLFSFQSALLGNRLGLFQIFFLALLFSPIWGYVAFSAWSFFVSIAGKLFGGIGTYKEIRAAYAWSSVPFVVNCALWVVLSLVFGRELFMNTLETKVLAKVEILLLLGVLVARFITAIWSLVIYVNALSEVQKFSVLKAIGNLIIAAIVLSALVYVILLVGVHGSRGMSAILPQAQFVEHFLN